MLLLADALAKIAPEVLPGDTALQVPWLNRVCDRFISGGKWAGTSLRWKGSSTATNFAIYNDAYGGRFVTLPRNLASILAAGHGSGESLQACFSADRIRGPWYEFAEGGWGVGDAVAGSGLQDAGDGFTCFRDLPNDSYLRVKTEVAETPLAEMLFRGLDENQEPIYTGAGAASYEGVKLVIGAALATTTTQIFSSIPGIVRKPVTYGPVRLYAVSVADATETLIALYDPGDTSPGFRRYRMACAQDSTTLHAMCKRRHVDIAADADAVIPSNLSAIELGFQGRRYDLASDPKTALIYWGDAFGILNGELGEYNGSATPRLQTERGFGLGRIACI